MLVNLSGIVVLLFSALAIINAGPIPLSSEEEVSFAGPDFARNNMTRRAHHKKCGCNCDCKDIVFYYSGRELPSIGPQAQWNYPVPDYPTNGGRMSIVDGRLVINSYPFNNTLPNLVDHFKFFLAANQPFTIPAYGEFSYSATINMAAIGVENQPFGAQVQDTQSDFRLASAGMNVIDERTGLAFEFFVTNTKIYAIYERLEFARYNLGPYYAFTFAIPVANTTANAINRLSINLNGAEKTARWIINGVEVYKVCTTGSLISRSLMVNDYGGVEEQVFPTSVRVAFGTFSFLEAYSPCNVMVPAAGSTFVCQYPANESGLVSLNSPGTQFYPRSGPPTPATFVENGTNPAYRLFGQGVIMGISDVSVGYCKALTCRGRKLLQEDSN